MQPHHKKLWRKIGLEKNFLQGTSHSDINNLLHSHSDQGEPFASKIDSRIEETSSFLKNQNKVEDTRFALMKPTNEVTHLHLAPCKPQNNSELAESPISKLEFSDFGNSCAEWEKNVGGNLKVNNQVEKNVEMLFEMIKSVRKNGNKPSHDTEYFEEESSHYKSSDFEPSFKKSICINSLVGTEMNQMGSYGSQLLPPKQRQCLRDLRSNSEKSIECKMVSSSEREYEEGLTDEIKESLQSEIIEVVECLDVGEVGRGIRLVSERKKVSEVMKRVKEFGLIWEGFGEAIKSEVKEMRQEIVVKISQCLKEKLEDLIDKIRQQSQQIAYLYGQNKELMEKLSQKQVFIKKTSEQVQKMSQTLNQIQKNKLLNTIEKEKDQMIERQQNQINRMYQKMEDIEQLQTANEFLKDKIVQLEEEITKSTQAEWKVKAQLEATIKLHEETNKQLTKKDQLIQELNIKQTKLQQELTQTYAKLDSIHFQLNGEFNQQLQAQQQLFLQKSNQEKLHFAQQIQIIKKQLQTTEKLYHSVLQEITKKINPLEIQPILKNFQLNPNHTISKILSNPLNHTHNLTHNSSKKLHLEDSFRLAELAQVADSDRQQSPQKNLRKTGFFGQASSSHAQIANHSKPIEQILEQNPKRYSTERSRSELNQQLAQYKTMYQTSTYKDKSKSKPKSPEGRSEKSYSSFYKDEKTPPKNVFSTVYPNKQRQRPNSSQFSPKRQSSEIFANSQVENKDLKMSKCQTKREYLSSHGGLDISFTNSQNYYNPDEVREQRTYDNLPLVINPMSSPSHSMAFETSYAQSSFLKTNKEPSPVNNYSNVSAISYKPLTSRAYSPLKKERDEIDEIVDKIKQKINQKFKYQKQQHFQIQGNLFKPTEFKQNIQISRNNSPLLRNQTNVRVSPSAKDFQKFSHGYPSKVNPLRASYVDEVVRSRSKSQTRARLKSPSLDNKVIASLVTPRVHTSTFQKLNHANNQISTANFAKPRLSPSSKPYFPINSFKYSKG